MFRFRRLAGPALIAALGLTLPAFGGDLDEFEVKRRGPFEFAEKPTVTRAGDKVTIRFKTKAFCDVTVAIEDPTAATGGEPKIIRHLACGVLGPNAPLPFQPNSLGQTIVWDGKDDAGKYTDDVAGLTVRVSLGLKPRFERTLFWTPHKRVGLASPVIAPAPEGVYLLENYVLDHGMYGGSQVKLFDHEGNYVRTIYPFPASKVDEVVGLRKHELPGHETAVPLKHGYYQAWLLPTGLDGKATGTKPHAIAASKGRIALVFNRLNRLASDGTSGGLPLGGPKTCFTVATPNSKNKPFKVGPRSAAFSPDGETLYLTGFVWPWRGHFFDWMHAVMRLDFRDGTKMDLFAGSTKVNDHGSGEGEFKVPTSVACDAKGRVYVSDYFNDRIQVFTPDGKLFKTIEVKRPARVDVHRKTGEITVFSWLLITRQTKEPGLKPTYTRLGPVENPRVITRCPLPLVGYSSQISWNRTGGLPYRMAVDSWAKQPTIWLVPGRARWHHSGNASIIQENWSRGIRLLVERDGKLVTRRNFTGDAREKVERLKPPILWRQRLYVNPSTGKLYVGEGDSGVSKTFNQLVEIEPTSGRIKLLDLPLGAEDICFDAQNRAYIRTDRFVVRYDARNWREIPFDYGEQRDKHGWGMGARAAPLISGLPTPGHRSSPFWHQGGIDVSLKGHIVVTTCNLEKKEDRRTLAQKRYFKWGAIAKKFTPKVYAGRLRWGEIHVYDRRGKPIVTDAVPGMGHLNGIGIDQHDHLYMLAASKRLIGGEKYDPALPRDASGTLVKVKAGEIKVLAAGGGRRVPIELPPSQRPKRPPEIQGWPTGWIEGADWFYGGVGFCTPGGCICVNSRFDLDYFNRSFAPEHLAYRVAVLDSAGNLITRVGRYGNVDDGRPLVREGGPAQPRSVGGDEAALFHACYVASHTDRRLFIADAGSARIVSVKLGYHAEDKVPLTDARSE
ncbi:MAG: hypothetical protein R6V58_06315 [Planctomycetota bacterium]